MPHQDKPVSILDSVPVVNQAFKSFPDYIGTGPATAAELVVVSSCAKCGCPVYGPRSVPAEVSIIGRNHIARGEPPVRIVRTCACVYMQKTLEHQTK